MSKHYNVLVLGSGGREHAIGWKLNQSRFLGQLFFGPGNAGTASIGKNTPIDINDFDQNEVINPVNSVSVSAKEGIGIEMLKDLVSNHANRGLFKGKLLINFNNSKVRSECYRKAKIINDEEINDGWV